MTEQTRVVNGNFQFEAQLPNGKRLVLNGYTFEGETGDSLNSRLDLYAAVADRQRFRAEIPELEARLEQHRVALEQHKDHLAGIQAQMVGKTPNQQQRNNVENVSKSIEAIVKEIAKGELAIAEAKAKGGL